MIKMVNIDSVSPVSSTNKTNRHDITEILLNIKRRLQNLYFLLLQKDAVLRRTSKDWLARNQDNVSEWERHVYPRTVASAS